MAIEESVSGKSSRDGMSSLERRRLVEKDLLQYNHLLNQTAQDFRKRPPSQPVISLSNKTTEGLFWERDEREKDEMGSVDRR